ncbi:dCTP deaminase [Arthrobacter sp. KFRI-F3372]|nr:dCTP deaminase [Arthrobacter oryzae]MDP9988316.1 dCTP deaminase [Arthrobacter oryzae]WHP60990.1 dCTP deaminase [Arthrobacter sp. KFRI-F3372]
MSQGAITIEPFTPDQVNPNSYDFRLASTLLTYDDDTLDTAAPNSTSAIRIPKDGLVLRPDRIYLGATEEKMGSNEFVPIIRGKSSIARLGLFINITADLIDLGSFNNWTLQLHAVQPLRIYPGMLIGQVTFWVPQGARSLYSGKYQGATGPRASESYRDFLPQTSQVGADRAW